MPGHPTWFGRDNRLFGWIHLPDDGRVTASVVLCPSIGREIVSAHPAFRLVAEALAERGFAVLRFDYDGTGDSSGDFGGPDAYAGWMRSIEEAAAYLRDAGARTLSLVGYRAGALLALQAAATVQPSTMVMWDPPRSGRSFLREQDALYSLLFEVPPDHRNDQLELPGYVLDAKAAGWLRKLTVDRSTPGLRRLLVLTESTSLAERIEARLAPVPVDHSADLPGRDWMLRECHPDTVAVGTIVGWIDANVARSDTTVDPPRRQEAVVGVAGNGTPIEERVQWLGPSRLFSIVTTRSGAAPRATVVFLNVGVEHHVGPARSWVQMSRALAATGLRAVRVDLGGLGDSPVRDGAALLEWSVGHLRRDARDINEALAPETPGSLVIVGLCASAVLAIDQAMSRKIGGVVALNPVLDWQAIDDPDVASLRVVTPKRGWVQLLFRIQAARAVRHHVPTAVWHALDALRIQRSPARGLLPLDRAGIQTMLICGPGEARPLVDKGRWILRRLERDPGFSFEVIEGLDHTLLRRDARARAYGLIEEHSLRVAAALTERRGRDRSSPATPARAGRGGYATSERAAPSAG